MKISLKELELIASTPENECFICKEIIENVCTDLEGNKYISSFYLRHNPDVREHLKQILKR